MERGTGVRGLQMRGVSRLAGVGPVAIEVLHGSLLRLLGMTLKDNLLALPGFLLAELSNTLGRFMRI